MAKYRDDDVIALLEGQGLSWRSFFVRNGSIVAFRDGQGRVMSLIIEDDSLQLAVCAFLLRQGLALHQEAD